MARPSADPAPAGRQHPEPERFLEFNAKMARAIGREYVIRNAKFIQDNYPGSAAALVPKLREIYRNTKP